MKKAKDAEPNILLKRAREERAMTQQQMADHLHTTKVSISRWENGTSSPSSFFRTQLSQFFEKSPQALGFLETETRKQPSPFPLYWNVPHQRNPFFIGHQALLEHLHAVLKSEKSEPQILAITGMGGIGKTQAAVEYAYRYAHTYQTILWTNADSYEALISDFHTIAQVLGLPEQRISDQKRLVQTVKQWLQQQRGWLFLFDNFENLAMIKDFLPQRGRGSVLLTTRSQILGPLAQKVDLEKLSQEEGATLILRRAKLLHGDDLLEKAQMNDQEKAREIALEMDGLPLALDQAAAYIEETQCSVAEYLDLYCTRRNELLQRRGAGALDHPDSVVTTFSFSFEKVEQENPVAADILRLCAFLHAEDIPDEIITSGAARVEGVLQKLAASFSEAKKRIPAEIAATLASEADNLLRRTSDPLCYHQAMQTLLKYSFIRRNTLERTLSTHRLVQAVMKDAMEKHIQRKWAGRAIRAVESLLAHIERVRNHRYLAQAYQALKKESEAHHHFQLTSPVSGMIADTPIDLFPTQEEHLFMLPTEISLGIAVAAQGTTRHFFPPTNEVEAGNDPKTDRSTM